MTSTISSQAINGVKWTSTSTIGRAIIQLVQLSIVAHFLSAQVLGLYALLQISIAFCQIFIGVGIGNAIIHQREITPRHLSELFVINLVIAFVISICFYIAAPLFAWFFEQEILQSYIELVSIAFIIIALSQVHLALLQKKLAFAVIAKVELLSAIIGFSIVVTMIKYDYGIESLIYGYLSLISLQSLSFWLISEFKPVFCLPHSWRELKNYLSFGAYQTGSTFVNYFNSQFDLILVGKLFGVEVLGGYSLVRQFCFRPTMVINPVLTKVAFPVMAKIQEFSRLSEVFCNLSRALALINFPLYTAFIIFASPIVDVFFGSQWLHMVPIFQMISLWCLLRSIANPIGVLLMAVGKVKLAFYWNCFLLALYPSAILLGSNWGVEGVTLSLVVLQISLLPGQWFYLLKKSIGISFIDFFSSFKAPLLISFISGSVTGLLVAQFTTVHSWVELLIGILFGALVYAVLSYKFNAFFRHVLHSKFYLEFK